MIYTQKKGPGFKCLYMFIYALNEKEVLPPLKFNLIYRVQVEFVIEKMNNSHVSPH